MTQRTRTRLESPRDRLLAVVDDPASVATVRAAVVAAGADPAGIEILAGLDAADGLDATGVRHGPLARIVRAIQFSLVDQLPDLAWYEAALRDGRRVLRIRARTLGEARVLSDAMAGAGAHFINHFGRFQTAALVPWRGPEPAVPDLMKR